MDVVVTAPSMGTCVHVTVGEHDTVGMMRKRVAEELGIGEAFVQLVLEEPDVADDECAAGYIGSGEAEAVVLHQKCDAKEILAEANITCDYSGLSAVLSDVELGHHVATLHEAGLDVLKREYPEQHPITVRAVKMCNIKALQAAIAVGCDISATSAENGYNAFHVAAVDGNEECLRCLLQHEDAKHFKNSRSTRGFTPVHCAASFNNTSCLDVLAEHGADLNAKTVNGMTPLFSACHGGRQAVEKLLDLGAYLYAKEKEGFSVLHMKCTNDMVDIFTSRGLSINAQSASRSTPLHAIIFNNARAGSVEHYIAKGAAVNQTNNLGQTPLHFAVLYNNAAIPVLLRHGATTDVRDAEGKTPLHHCKEVLLNDHLKKLIEHSERSVNSRDRHGKTPLHYTCDCNMVKYLVKHGADPTLYDVRRQTPAYHKTADVRKQLFKCGCPKDTADIYGFPPGRSVSGAERVRRATSMPWAKLLELSELP